MLIEPAMTNIGIVLPGAGYHQALRDLTKRSGTLLVIDETHTVCAGPGGAARAYNLEPDFLTIGKTIGGGIPAAAYGFTEAVRDRILAAMPPQSDVGGVGGTLAGNVLSLAAIRATLGEVLTEAAFAHMISLGALRGRCRGRHLRPCPALERHPPRLPRGVLAAPRARPDRREGGRRGRCRARPIPPPLCPESGNPHDSPSTTWRSCARTRPTPTSTAIRRSSRRPCLR